MAGNIEGSERRLQVVKAIIHSFNSEVDSATPVAFFSACQFPFNNFLYHVKLQQPISTAFAGTQPGTTAAPPHGVDSVLVRLSNLRADGLNNVNRVQNEVACSMLARDALASAGLGSLVPAIFAWSGPKALEPVEESNFGWLVSEFKKGTDLECVFDNMPDGEEQQSVIETIAKITRALQTLAIPPSADQFGGLAFDDAGTVVSSQTSLLSGGPWTSYADLWASKLQAQLTEAKAKPALGGWKEQDAESRISKFITSGGLKTLLEPVGLYRRCLVHGDFTMNNMLYDKETKQITALLDFDWASVTHPSEEYFTGFSNVGYNISDDPDQIMSAILADSFSDKPQDLPPEEEKLWEPAKSWNALAAKHHVITPADIPGIRDLMDLHKLHSALCPFDLCNAMVAKSLSEEVKLARKKESLAVIISFLEKRGF